MVNRICQICGKTFKNGPSFRTHWSLFHRGEKRESLAPKAPILGNINKETEMQDSKRIVLHKNNFFDRDQNTGNRKRDCLSKEIRIER